MQMGEKDAKGFFSVGNNMKYSWDGGRPQYPLSECGEATLWPPDRHSSNPGMPDACTTQGFKGQWSYHRI